MKYALGAICIGLACAALQKKQPESVIATFLLIIAFIIAAS